MRSTAVWPSATKPAITRQADARRSVAITVAPDRRGWPSITATLPSTWIRAPRRSSSSTCMKRFSKIVSVTVAVPWAMQSRAMNWACMSVGKPGYSVVRKPWALHADAARERLHIGAGGAQLFDHRVQVVGAAMAQQHIAAGGRHGAQKGAGLDTV